MKQAQKRGEVYERILFDLGFTSDWIRKWREIFEPITKRFNAKASQTPLIWEPLYLHVY